MTNQDGIADLISSSLRSPEGPEDAGFHTGLVLTWDRTTGLNTVQVNGVVMSNLKALQGGIPAWYATGDTVVIIRKQTQYFIMGRVAAPGFGAGSGPVSSGSGLNVVFNTANLWADAPGFANTPQITTYIGNSRACIVTMACEVYVRVGDPAFSPSGDVHNPLAEGGISVAITGATTIAPDTYAPQSAFNRLEYFNHSGALEVVQSLISINRTWMINPSVGLNVGSTTFTMKYKTQGGTVQFANPNLIVIPL